MSQSQPEAQWSRLQVDGLFARGLRLSGNLRAASAHRQPALLSNSGTYVGKQEIRSSLTICTLNTHRPNPRAGASDDPRLEHHPPRFARHRRADAGRCCARCGRFWQSRCPAFWRGSTTRSALRSGSSGIFKEGAMQEAIRLQMQHWDLIGVGRFRLRLHEFGRADL